jgi:hypothetical protein
MAIRIPEGQTLSEITSYEDASEKETSNKDTSSEDASNKDASEEETASEEGASEEETSDEGASEDDSEDASYEETSYEGASYEDDSEEDYINPQNQKQPPPGFAWSQLETMGEIFSKRKTLTEAGEQAASYLYFLLQARPDLISVVGIFYYPKENQFALYFADAWNILHTKRFSVRSPTTKKLLVAWMRRLYNPERNPDITRMDDFHGTPTFIINTRFPGRLPNCRIMSVGSVRRRATIFTTTYNESPVAIKSQYFKVGRRFEESKILCTIHDGKVEFPGVVRVLKGGGKESESGGIIVEGEPSDVEKPANVTKPTDKDWLDQRRGRAQVLQTQLVLEDVEKPFMDVKRPLEALIAIYDLLEGNKLSLFLE